jgi:hypothetical protein
MTAYCAASLAVGSFSRSRSESGCGMAMML